MKKVTFKLTEKDKEFLKKHDCLDKYFPRIEQAGNLSNYFLCEHTLVTEIETRTPISHTKAIKLLGRESFLNGLFRSALHWTAYQNLTDNSGIYFDSTML